MTLDCKVSYVNLSACALAIEKVVVLAPMPMASDSAAVMAKSGLLGA